MRLKQLEDPIIAVSTGERGLYSAVIATAIHDLKRGKGSTETVKSRDYIDATNWFYSAQEATVTFKSCCDILDLDVDVILDQLVAIGVLVELRKWKRGRSLDTPTSLPAIN